MTITLLNSENPPEGGLVEPEETDLPPKTE